MVTINRTPFIYGASTLPPICGEILQGLKYLQLLSNKVTHFKAAFSESWPFIGREAILDFVLEETSQLFKNNLFGYRMTMLVSDLL